MKKYLVLDGYVETYSGAQKYMSAQRVAEIGKLPFDECVFASMNDSMRTLVSYGQLELLSPPSHERRLKPGDLCPDE